MGVLGGGWAAGFCLFLFPSAAPVRPRGGWLAPSRMSLRRRYRAERALRACGLSLRGENLLPPRYRGLDPSHSPGQRRQTSIKCFIQVTANRKPKGR